MFITVDIVVVSCRVLPRRRASCAGDERPARPHVAYWVGGDKTRFYDTKVAYWRCARAHHACAMGRCQTHTHAHTHTHTYYDAYMGLETTAQKGGSGWRGGRPSGRPTDRPNGQFATWHPWTPTYARLGVRRVNGVRSFGRSVGAALCARVVREHRTRRRGET